MKTTNTKGRKVIHGKKHAPPQEKGTPGRPRLYPAGKDPEAALRERKRQYLVSDEWKAKRRKRYSTDSVYREQCIERARRYSEAKKADEARNYLRRVSARVERIDARRDRFTVPQLAKLIERPAGAVYGWIRAGRFPAPQHTQSTQRGDVMVYTGAQAKRLAEAVAVNLRTPSAHLTAHRVSVILSLFRAVR